MSVGPDLDDDAVLKWLEAVRLFLLANRSTTNLQRYLVPPSERYSQHRSVA